MAEKQNKKTFMFNYSWHEVLKEYPPEIRLEVYDAVVDYAESGKLSELSPLAKMAFSFIKNEMDNHKPPKGESHWNWKGGITNESHRIRTSSDYKEWRRDVFERDNYTCRKCGAEENLNAHHILPFSVYPKLRFDVDNGITLCKQCHIELHKKERKWAKNHS